MTTTLNAVTTQSWKTDVLESDKPVLVDFWAEWCGPCHVIAPVLNEIAGEIGDKAKIVKLNIDENPEVGQAYQVLSIPTLLLFKDGELVATTVGVQPKRSIVGMLEKSF